MTYRIGKTFEFSASHKLEQLPEGHKCRNNHGHNYTVEIILESDELDEFGFVLDYGDLDGVKRYVDEYLDHGKQGPNGLNDLIDHPTAEVLAEFIYTIATERLQLRDVVEVKVGETPKVWASYSPSCDCGDHDA